MAGRADSGEAAGTGGRRRPNWQDNRWDLAGDEEAGAVAGAARWRWLLVLAPLVLVVAGCAADPAPPAADPAPPAAGTAAPSATTATSTAAGATLAPTTTTAARAATRYAFPIKGCAVSFGSLHHDYPATDIFAKAGCSVVAPASGVVDEVSRVDRWGPDNDDGDARGGLSFSIVGADGVRYYGSHLSVLEARIKPGLRIEAGAPVGKVGHTGSARGVAPHLHFGLSWPTRPGVWWVRRGVVPPAPFLRAWQAGEQRSPARAVAAARAAAGAAVPPCQADC
jgi:murein DD-endopeptidase MepM/ murein hydrolase activator NlpD